jgi:hypothetical protein
MSEITLVVTQPVVNHVLQDHPNEKQIAIRASTRDVAPTIQQLTAMNRRTLRLGGCIDLILGDPGAVWRAHNGQQVQGFDALYNLLERRPNHEMRFLCEII